MMPRHLRAGALSDNASKQTNIPAFAIVDVDSTDGSDTVVESGQNMESASGVSKNNHTQSEEERKKSLETDPSTRDVEPHRVFCLVCNTTVKLGDTRRYDLQVWNKHAESCKGSPMATTTTMERKNVMEIGAEGGSATAA